MKIETVYTHYCEHGPYQICPFEKDESYCKTCLKARIQFLRKELKRLNGEKKDER